MDLPPFQALLDAQGRDVHRFLVAIVGPSDAEDCYQETWLAALKAYPRLHDAANLRAWILTVAHRKAIDHVRARNRRPTPVAELPDAAIPAVEPDGVPEIWTHVRALPAKQRTAIALRTVADLAYPDIARVMGTSEEAARRSVHEALKRLRTEVSR
ncbi:MAG TPA: sigma-70 family RNA polymerase sigma factor [Solirubrobacteraceae bacterium]|nr:sigma-70 family RNA polymerase sigma factor [Solirubrobacteraceae bacterium]